MNTKLKFLLALLISSSVLLGACGEAAIRETAPTMADLQKAADPCRDVYTGQVDAWKTGDADLVQEIYTEDIVHFDGGPLVGIEDVMFMARFMLMYFNDWEMDAGRTYISESDCLGTWMFWGRKEFTRENPRREFHTIEIRDEKISYWRLFYDENFDFSPINFTLLEDFAAAWSSGDPQAVESLYAEGALLEDSLFGISAAGRDEIRKVAVGFEKDHPGATWELIYSFSEGADPDQPDLLPSHGGIYQVTPADKSGEACPVQVGVILTPDPEGLIASQITLYSAEDLVQCGWVK